MEKKIAIVGLGKMGHNQAIRLLHRGWKVIGHDTDSDARLKVESEGGINAPTLADLVSAFSGRRLVWLMIPAGSVGDTVLFGKGGLASLLEEGDIVIDGGNSNYEDTLRRAEQLRPTGIRFMDVGVSGGPGGALNGACLMIGGDAELFRELEPLFQDMSKQATAYAHVGPIGAGHFVKMVHNGIEYGMMQAIAEGFEVLKQSQFKPSLVTVAKIYQNGSVIESRLVNWALEGFKQYGENLDPISGIVGHTGEGEWTVKAAEKLGVPVPVIKASFDFRVQSAEKPSFTGKVLSMLRNMFGGHVALKKAA